ncbi:MAG: TonB-dependent receptor [Bacteroidales bacterium]|jgi:hemoglobin/transferrin/lactoferrin receptor protein|nr:TonB-dependent receptor [Bacteroidales bacterium]
MKYIIIIPAFVFIFFSGFSQKVKVLDKSDLQPIGQVTISNHHESLMIVTDANGIADISAIPDTATLLFSHVAFQPLRILKSNIPSNKTIYLTENIIKLDEFVYTANRVEEKKSDLPYKIEVIQAKDIVFQNPQNAAIMLEQTGQVFVQTSQMGGGSPVLRGFEANKVLLVVDGIRMNNAVYRAGHLQNAITVDPFGLASTEILYGPGSTIFGSDALGGVINFRTKDPVLSSSGKTEIHGNVLGRFASANTEKTGGINLNFGWKKLGVLLNFSYSDFDDLREGKVRDPALGDFGTRPVYAQRINGKDSMVINDKPWIQKTSGYSQYNFLGKVLFKPGEHSNYILNVQYSNSSDIPRYDRLTEMNGSTGKLQFAEWYYGPQTRLLASLKAEYNVKGVIFDHASVILGYQNIHEDRIQRDFGSSKKKFNLETVGVISLNADFDKKICTKDNLRYGIELDYNNVISKAHNENIKTGASTDDRATRYPDQKANMMYISAYLSNNWNISKVFAFSQGIRFNYVTLNAAYSDTMVKIMDIPFNPDIAQKNAAVNGYLGLVATPGRDWKFSLVGSTGFRAPNIDDLTKLNVVNGQTIVVPNPDLKPEYAYNIELSVAKTIIGKVRLEGTAFYTWLRDAHVIAPFKYNGLDSITIDGEKYQTLAPTNAGRAYVCGVQGSLLAQITHSFSILSNLTYTYGYDESSSDPLDHIPPVFGMTSFRLELKKFKGDFYVMYNGWKRISQYSPGGEDNDLYATPYGMPSWYTLNLKLSYQVIKYLNIELGMENILDENYRKFASGISSPGRNVIVALRCTF